MKITSCAALAAVVALAGCMSGNAFNPDENVTVLFTGGELRFPKKSMTGDLAIQTINSITANKCFIGCSGLTAFFQARFPSFLESLMKE